MEDNSTILIMGKKIANYLEIPFNGNLLLENKNPEHSITEKTEMFFSKYPQEK